MEEKQPKRKNISIAIDERILAYIEQEVAMSGLSRNKYLERLFMQKAQYEGKLPPDFVPIREGRGGAR